MTQALEHRPETALLSEKSIANTKEQLDLLTRLVHTVLKEGGDYGTIPGTDRPTLLKPGADNVCAAFNVYPEPLVLHETVDPDKGYISYTIGVKLISRMDGQIKSQGMGQCNSYETKYRYRWEGTGDARKKVVNADPLEQANTILKMAEKRGYVDAVMKLPGVARFFTQDAEDYPVADGKPSPGTGDLCPVHGVKFFQSGKMREPAHKLDDGSWCNKSKVVVKAPPAEESPKPQVDHWAALEPEARVALREMGYTTLQAATVLGAPLDAWLAADKLRTPAEAIRMLREAKNKKAGEV